MRKILLGSVAAATLTAAAVVIAQPAPVAPVVQPAPPASPLRILQPQTRNEVVEKVRAHFAQLDTNRDGYLTKAEGEAGREAWKDHGGKWAGRGAQGERPAMDHGAMFDRLDANRDGTISREEFDRGHEQRQAIRVMHKEGGKGMRMGMGMGGRMFDQADANHDSRVSLQEATDAALKHFDTADLNRDGTLSPEERQQMHQRMKETHRVTRPS
jgi:Ca2+-binding EF-hand superfamily protein